MLPNIPLFSDLEETEASALAGKMVMRHYPRNTIIISEGDHSDSLYCILSGRVKVFLNDEEGKEVILNDEGPGDYFGELALLDSGPRSASVVTLEDCKMAVISKADFEEFLSLHRDATRKIMRGLVKRLRALTDNVRSLALMDVYGRVARVLLELAVEEGDALVIRETLTQQDIASRVGASREMVSRILKELRTGGYIEVRKKHIVIRKTLPHHW
jgi:CRP/FNR family cyclic AMP-dependent transcriptional regulator